MFIVNVSISTEKHFNVVYEEYYISHFQCYFLHQDYLAGMQMVSLKLSILVRKISKITSKILCIIYILHNTRMLLQFYCKLLFTLTEFILNLSS